jgi:hypothetical protein
MPTNSLTADQVRGRAAMCYAGRKCFITLKPLEGPQLAYAFHQDAGTNVLVDTRFVPKEKEEGK